MSYQAELNRELRINSMSKLSIPVLQAEPVDIIKAVIDGCGPLSEDGYLFDVTVAPRGPAGFCVYRYPGDDPGQFVGFVDILGNVHRENRHCPAEIENPGEGYLGHGENTVRCIVCGDQEPW